MFLPYFLNPVQCAMATPIQSRARAHDHKCSTHNNVLYECFTIVLVWFMRACVRSRRGPWIGCLLRAFLSSVATFREWIPRRIHQLLFDAEDMFANAFLFFLHVLLASSRWPCPLLYKLTMVSGTSPSIENKTTLDSRQPPLKPVQYDLLQSRRYSTCSRCLSLLRL